MSQPLAIVLPEIGVRSETFIRRHVCDLLPGQCVAVTDPPPNSVVERQGGPDWLSPTRVIEGNPGPSDPGDPPPTNEQVTAVAELLREAGVRVVLGEYLDFSLRWLPLFTDHGFRFFAHGHGVDMTRQLRDPVLRERYLHYCDIDGIVVPTAAAKADLVEIGLPDVRINVVPYGTDIPPRSGRDSDTETVRCVAVGRMVPKKAPQAALHAFAEAYKRCPDLRLEYVGDGPLRPEVESLAANLDLGSAVCFHGALAHDQTLEIIRSADVLLHGAEVDPSGDAEGLPLVILEAMAAGVPVVATDHKGISEAVLHGQTGLVSPEGDVAGLAHSLVVLARSTSMRASLGDSGRARAGERYSWERNRRDLLAVLGLDEGP